ncbi:MAG: hypothetical protein O3A14_18710 [Cyanobacteria bacterium]|nr:hypothetical protein [Cyanobacteriota bacterium]
MARVKIEAWGRTNASAPWVSTGVSPPGRQVGKVGSGSGVWGTAVGLWGVKTGAGGDDSDDSVMVGPGGSGPTVVGTAASADR